MDMLSLWVLIFALHMCDIYDNTGVSLFDLRAETLLCWSRTSDVPTQPTNPQLF